MTKINALKNERILQKRVQILQAPVIQKEKDVRILQFCKIRTSFICLVACNAVKL